MPRPGSTFDLLRIEVLADQAGWRRSDTPSIVGACGVEHRFSVVATSGRGVTAFDVLEDVGEQEVLRAQIMAIDTKAEVVLVSSSGRVTKSASQLAAAYGVRVVKGEEVPALFEKMVVAPDGTHGARGSD